MFPPGISTAFKQFCFTFDFKITKEGTNGEVGSGEIDIYLYTMPCCE